MKLFSRRYFILLTLIYSAFICYGTTVPFRLELALWPDMLDRVFSLWRDMNFVTQPGDVAANFFLFFILGVFLKCIFLKYSSHYWWKMLAISLYGFVLSYFIEVIQILFPGRISSLFDVLIDGLSSLAGILSVGLLQGARIDIRFSRLLVNWLRTNPYLLASIATACFYLLGAVFPFSAVPQASFLWERFRFESLTTFFTNDWADPQIWIKCLYTFFLYVLFSYVTFIALVYQNRGSSRTALCSAVFSSFILILNCEFFQIFFPPPYFELSQILVAVSGAVLGAGLGVLIRPLTQVRVVLPVKAGRQQMDMVFLVALGIVTLLALIDWLRPFHLVSGLGEIRMENLRRMEFVPFQGYTKALFWTFEGFFRKFYLLLGWSVCFTLWMTERFRKPAVGPFLAGLCTSVLALTLEIFQIPMIGRVFSITEAFWGFIAGILGVFLADLVIRPKRRLRDTQ